MTPWMCIGICISMGAFVATKCVYRHIYIYVHTNAFKGGATLKHTVPYIG